MKAETNKKGNENILTRVDTEFKKWLENIRQKRLESKIDKYPISDRALTKFIPKWGSAPHLEEDLITLNIGRRKQ